jgi:hypothetical protein
MKLSLLLYSLFCVRFFLVQVVLPIVQCPGLGPSVQGGALKVNRWRTVVDRESFSTEELIICAGTDRRLLCAPVFCIDARDLVYDLSLREFYDWECFFRKTTIILKDCSTRGLAAFGVCQEILFGFCSSSRPIDRAARFQHLTQTCAKQPDAKRDRIAAFCRCPVSLKNQTEGVCLFSAIFFVPCTIVSIFCAQSCTLLEFCCLPSL